MENPNAEEGKRAILERRLQPAAFLRERKVPAKAGAPKSRRSMNVGA
jgi:hypothetical protein